MTDLENLRENVLKTLNDIDQYVYSNDVIDQAIRYAIADYTIRLPNNQEEIITMAVDGEEIDLSTLEKVHIIWRVFYPWDTTKAYGDQERNRVLRWEHMTIDKEVKMLMDVEGGKPKAGEKIRLIYGTDHKLNGLDGGTETTIDNLILITKGAVGYALLYTATDRSDLMDKALAEKISSTYLGEFRQKIETIKTNEQRGGRGIINWQGMDKYDQVQ